jgi:hypothetical protein
MQFLSNIIVSNFVMMLIYIAYLPRNLLSICLIYVVIELWDDVLQKEKVKICLLCWLWFVDTEFLYVQIILLAQAYDLAVRQ